MAKGKISVLLLLLLFGVSVNCNQQEPKPKSDIIKDESLLSALDRQEIQLKKLESLVTNLTQLVASLQAASLQPHDHKLATEGRSGTISSIVDDDKSSIDGAVLGEGSPPGGGGGPVTKYNPSWSERFQFLSAVKLDSEATCINVLPFHDEDGFSKYIAVGDERGRLYVFSPTGDVLVDIHTSAGSSITAMLSYMSHRKNESVLVTGHENGVVLIHYIMEVTKEEDWHALSIENFRSFPPVENAQGPSPITILEMNQPGRMKFIVATDVRGNIRVFRENGTVYGSVLTKSRPLAFLKHKLLFLTENGAGSLDLKSMKVRESECEGMNRSIVRSYVFDVTEPTKAYGFTMDGDLIYVVLLGEITNYKCRIRSKRKFEMAGPLVFKAIKGYLLVVSEEKVFVYNISTQHYVRVGAPRPLFFASLDEIRSSFLNIYGSKEAPKSGVMPLITTDEEKLIVLGLGSGYVGMYRSALPFFISESHMYLWVIPLVLFALFLCGVWLFFGKKKESLTSWGSEDPFSSTQATSGPTVGSGSGERPFADSSSRTTDLRDSRGGGLRGTSRRYGSPSRFPAGPTIPFRASSAEPNFRANSAEPNFRATSSDHNFRATSSDHNFRGAGELKYRGTGLDPPGFPKRRDAMFPTGQAGEDSFDKIS